MPETPAQRQARLKKRAEVDAFMAKKRKVVSKTAAAKRTASKARAVAASKTPAAKAKVRRDTIVKKAAPKSGFGRLLAALTPKPKKKKK